MLKRGGADTVHNSLQEGHMQWVTPPHNISFPGSAIPNQGSAEHRYDVRHKLWNKYTTIFKYLKRFQNIPRNVAGIFVRQLAILE